MDPNIAQKENKKKTETKLIPSSTEALEVMGDCKRRQ